MQSAATWMAEESGDGCILPSPTFTLPFLTTAGKEVSAQTHVQRLPSRVCHTCRQEKAPAQACSRLKPSLKSAEKQLCHHSCSKKEQQSPSHNYSQSTNPFHCSHANELHSALKTFSWASACRCPQIIHEKQKGPEVRLRW